MELTKLQCTSCGSAMEIKPGIDRVRCPFCGMNYLIERKETPQTAGGSKTVYGDNPADVLLVPVSANTFFLEIKDLCCREIQDLDDAISNRQILNNQFELITEQAVKHLKSFACLTYVTHETYRLDFGCTTLDPVYMYYTGRENLKDRKRLSKADTAYLVEPSKVYSSSQVHVNNRLKKQQFPTIAYDKNDNAKANRETKSRVDSFLKKYHFSFSDELTYSDIGTETYTKPALRGDDNLLFSTKKHYRYWVVKYIKRKLFIEMNADTAKLFLSAEEKANIERMGKNACIADIAAILYRELSKEAKLQLNTRKSGWVKFTVTSDAIQYENPRYKTRHKSSGGSRYFDLQEFITIPYSKYGMNQISSETQRCYLLAQLMKHINSLISENKDTKWNMTNVNVKNNCQVELRPAVKTVGVYNDWL